jgi:hypothetical protein
MTGKAMGALHLRKLLRGESRHAVFPKQTFYDILKKITMDMHSQVKLPGRLPAGGGKLLVLLLVVLAMTAGCGHIPPAPEGFDPESYTPITYDQLLSPGPAGLGAGQKVAVEAYFWQYLTYDPAPPARYLALAGNPLGWRRMRWASLYRVPQMQGYYDRLVLDEHQKRDFRLKRLERVRVYGEMAALSLGVLYLRVHQVDRLEPPEPLEAPPPPPAADESRESGS